MEAIIREDVVDGLLRLLETDELGSGKVSGDDGNHALEDERLVRESVIQRTTALLTPNPWVFKALIRKNSGDEPRTMPMSASVLLRSLRVLRLIIRHDDGTIDVRRYQDDSFNEPLLVHHRCKRNVATHPDRRAPSATDSMMGGPARNH
jgi:hypothetical protein